MGILVETFSLLKALKLVHFTVSMSFTITRQPIALLPEAILEALLSSVPEAMLHGSDA